MTSGTWPAGEVRSRCWRSTRSATSALRSASTSPPGKKWARWDGLATPSTCSSPDRPERSGACATAIRPSGWRPSAGKQLACPPVGRRVAQLRHGPSLDLPNALPGQAEMLPDFVQGPGFAPIEPEAQPEDFALAFVQGDQHLVD